MRTRLVEVDDATAIMNIYNPEVTESSISFDLVPRTLARTRGMDSRHHRHPPLHRGGQRGGRPSAKSARGANGSSASRSVSPFRDRPAYATTVENSVYVARAARGRGVGEVLLRQLMTLAEESGFHSLIARIVGENASSIRLHEKCGFTLVGTEIEVGRKQGVWLDVVEYQYVMPDASA